jgi:hypothetical protein
MGGGAAPHYQIVGPRFLETRQELTAKRAKDPNKTIRVFFAVKNCSSLHPFLEEKDRRDEIRGEVTCSRW